MSSHITSEMGEHIFVVDFELLKNKAKKIKPEVYQSEIVEKINHYSNDKNELKLSTIIDLTNEIATIKEVLFENEEDGEDGNSISRTSCEEIIEYLENFVSEKVFNVKPEEQSISLDNIKVSEEIKSPLTEEIKKDEELNLNKSPEITNIVKNYGIEENVGYEKNNEKQHLSSVSKEEIKNEFKALQEQLIFSLSDLYKEQIDPKIEQLEKTWKKEITNFIQKSENDKKIIESGLENIKTHMKNSVQDLLATVGQKVDVLVSTTETYTKSINDIIKNTIKQEMENAINENKIKTELEEGHVKSLNGVKTSVILSMITCLITFILLFGGVKWYSNSVKYENILKVEKSLPPYEQDLFNQIITKGYANTRENPRNNR